jgi:hypothetical protein
VNESLQKPWLLVIEVPPESRDLHSYTVCGFNTRILAERQRKRLEQLRQTYERGRMESDDEISMPDGNVLFPTQIGTMHLFMRYGDSTSTEQEGTVDGSITDR